MPCGQKKRTSEMSQSHTVTPPLAAMEGTTFRLKTATTNRRTRSRRPRPCFNLARRLLASLGGQPTRLSLREHYHSHRVLQSSRDRGARGADKQCPPRVKQSSSAQPRPVGLRVPVVLSLAMRRCRRRPPGACQYRHRCAGRKWSIVHPTSTVAPSRRGSPSRTSSDARGRCRWWPSRGSCEFPSDKT